MGLGSSDTDAIKARTLNLTLGSGFAAFVASGVVVFNDSFKSIFGKDLTGSDLADAKVKVLVPVIVAFAAIAVADLLTRAWTTAATSKAEAIKAAAKLEAEAVKTAAAQSYVLAAAPAGLTAKRTIGTDVDGFVVGALRFRLPDQVEYLIVKAGVAQEWVPSRHLELSAAAAAQAPCPAPTGTQAEAQANGTAKSAAKKTKKHKQP